MPPHLHYCAPVKSNSQKTLNEIRSTAIGYQKTGNDLELVTIPHILHTFCTNIFLIN